MARLPLGRPGLVVLLDQLPSVDGIPGGHVSGATGVCVRLAAGPVWSLLIQLAFIWIVTVVAFYPVCDSIIILNLSAAIKILLAVTVGVLGIVYVAKNGFVNDMTALDLPAVLRPGQSVVYLRHHLQLSGL